MEFRYKKHMRLSIVYTRNQKNQDIYRKEHPKVEISSIARSRKCVHIEAAGVILLGHDDVTKAGCAVFQK